MSTVFTKSPSAAVRFAAVSPVGARVLLIAAVLAAGLGGIVVADTGTAAQAAIHADGDLTRLLRAMAVLKAVMAAGATAAVFWRLGAAAPWPWLAAYLATCAAMVAGPGVIWGMAHVGLGALLLHGGLLAAILLLWRDPAVGARLSALVASRRAALRARGA